MKFLRTSTRNFIRLGKNRKKKQKWRKPRGRHNKIREKRKGKPRKVEIGYRKNKKERGKIKGKIPIIIKNVKELENINKDENIIIIGKVGKKKKKEILEIAEKKGIEILNKPKINEVK